MEALTFQSLAGYASTPTTCDNVVIVCDCDNINTIFDSNDVCAAVGVTDDNKAHARAAAKKCTSPGLDKGASATFTVAIDEDTLRTITICTVPTACCRNNTPSKSHAVGALVKANRGSGNLQVVLVPSVSEWSSAQAVAVSRQFPLYCEKKIFRDNSTNLL